MQCFYCPQKDVSLVPWDSLSSADQALLRDKYPDAGEGAVCDTVCDTLKKAKKPRVLKTVTIAQRVEKYGKYGLYDNNGKLYRPGFQKCR